MPPVVAAAAAAAGSISAVLGTAVIGTITVGNILMAAYVVGSALEGRRRAKAAAARARRQYLDSLQDRAVMVRSAAEPRKLVYGIDKVSGPIADMFTTGTNDEYLHIIVALTGKRVAQIPIVYLNEYPIALSSLDASGEVTLGQWVESSGATKTVQLTSSSGGVVTLPEAASAVVAVSTQPANDDGASSISSGWSHTPGSTSVTGLPVSQPLSITYSTSSVRPCVRIHAFTGAPGETIPTALLTETGGRRTTAHAGQGMAWVWVRLRWSQAVFGSIGVPNISAQVWGHLVRDPRTGTTAHSDNAALCTADYVLDQQLGLRCDAATVPDAELSAEANICDEAVTINAGGALQKRYTVNGALSAGDGRLDNLEALVDSMAGSAVWAQGRWRLYAGAYRTPEPLTITEDHLGAKPPQLQRRPPRRDLFNGVRARYRDAGQGYTETTAPPVLNSTYQTQDGGRRVIRDITLPLVNDAIRAQRLAKIALERARQATTIQLQTSLRGYDLLPGQVVPVKLARYGWATAPFASGKPMEVRRRSWSARDGTIDYVLRETAASVYAWAYGEATVVDDAPDTALPSPWAAPAALTGVAASSGASAANAYQQTDGTRITSVQLTWTATANPFVLVGGHIEVMWQDMSTGRRTVLAPLPGDAAQAVLAPVPERRVIVASVRAVTADGRPGPWAHVTHLVQPPARVPSTVASLSAAVKPGGVLFTWPVSTDLNRDEIELRVGGASWAAGSAIYRGKADNFFWTWPSAGSYTVRARYLDRSGAYSAADATASVTVDEAALINVAELRANAATKVHTTSASAITVDGMTGVPTGDFTQLLTFTFTPPVSCEVLVSAEGSFSIATPATAGASGAGIYAVLTTRVTVNGTQQGPLRTYAIFQDIGLSAQASGQFARVQRFSATGGVEYVVVVEAQKLHPNTDTTVNDCALRIEEIRR